MVNEELLATWWRSGVEETFAEDGHQPVDVGAARHVAERGAHGAGGPTVDQIDLVHYDTDE